MMIMSVQEKLVVESDTGWCLLGVDLRVPGTNAYR